MLLDETPNNFLASEPTSFKKFPKPPPDEVDKDPECLKSLITPSAIKTATQPKGTWALLFSKTPIVSSSNSRRNSIGCSVPTIPVV